jgi:alkylhydroperoxidase family enzyme
VRFDSAREAGLHEEKVDGIADGYEARFAAAEVAALRLTDAVIGDPRGLDADARAALAEAFTPGEIVELALGSGLFLGMSKVLINLGLEPEEMPVTVIPTPGSTRGRSP